MSRISRDSPGMKQNVPRPGQVHSGTMQRPGINFSITKYVDFAILYSNNQEVIKSYLRHQHNYGSMQHSTISTKLIKAELLTQMNVNMDSQSLPKLLKGKKNCCLSRKYNKDMFWHFVHVA